MRLIRSESCTFIWQPNVRMHAVLDAPPGLAAWLAAVLPSGGPAGTGVWVREGFSMSGIGATSFLAVFVVVLLILVLRLVDVGFQDHLSGARFNVELREVHVARVCRPPQDAPYLIEVLGSHREYRPSGPKASRHPRAGTAIGWPIRRPADRWFARHTRSHLHSRRDHPRDHPLHRPQRHL